MAEIKIWHLRIENEGEKGKRGGMGNRRKGGMEHFFLIIIIFPPNISEGLIIYGEKISPLKTGLICKEFNLIVGTNFKYLLLSWLDKDSPCKMGVVKVVNWVEVQKIDYQTFC